MDTNQPTSLFEMKADTATQSHLNSVSKWGRFIAVTALIILVVGIIVLITAQQEIIDELRKVISFDDNLAGALIAIMVVLCALVVAWVIFLLRAAVLIKQGLVSRNSDRLAEGFNALRIFFVLSMIMSLLSILSTVSSMINR